MTKKDKLLFTHFILRTSMYVGREEKDSIVSFIYGYETGRGNKCDFSSLIKDHFSQKLKVKHSSDGWPGQIERYAKKRNRSWIEIFKQEGLDIIATLQPDKSQSEIQDFFRSRLFILLDGIGNAGTQLREFQINDWNLLCATNKVWFKSMWSEQEYKCIKTLKRDFNSILKKDRDHIITENLFKQIQEFNQSTKSKPRKGFILFSYFLHIS